MKCYLCCFLSVLAVCACLATQEPEPADAPPFRPTPDLPDLDPQPVSDVTPHPAALGTNRARQSGPALISGPIAPAGTQPRGVLSGRIVFTSGGHGWNWTGSAWALERPLLLGMNEDYGNVDQMTMFVYHCFNAGATVVPFRPVGNQTNEVVLDNTSARVTWAGAWADSTSSIYFGAAGAIPYRHTTASAVETATATYTPALPASGFYPVYTWVLSGANRTNQLYRINHTGGQSQVRIPHYLVGNGWVYLGTYYFNAGASPSQGSVVISNLGEGTDPIPSAIIADAIRFGNGMGDVNPGGGVSTYPREEEASRYWIQRSLGQGQDSAIYANNVSAPPRMAAEMNRQAAGNMYRRFYVGFHSNAGGGSARGVTALYNDPALSPDVAPGSDTPNQREFATILGAEVNADMVSIPAPPLEVAWHNRGNNIIYARSDYAFGEINNNVLDDEMDATIVEVAFHDNTEDAKLLRDPKARNWIARAVLHGCIRYLNQFDGNPLVFPPEPPVNVRATGMSGGIRVSWSPPITQAGSGMPTNYLVYVSRDGYGFGSPASVPFTGAAVQNTLFTNLPANTDCYFRVAAVNAGGESFPSETVGCRPTTNSLASRILYVNGFTRFDRTLNLRQMPAARQYKPPGHDDNSGPIDRVLPRSVNAFDYVVPHAKAIAASAAMPFDSCQLQAVTNGMISLASYDIVVWASGNQSTADRTFNNAAQARIGSYLAAGRHLFVTGSEIAWDLDRASGPSAADRAFLHNQLHAAFGSDANDDSGVYSFLPATGSLFNGNSTGSFDDGTRGIYRVGYPDAVVPNGAGAAQALTYPGYSSGGAGISYDGSVGGGRVVYWGFPFETITSPSVRAAYMGDVLRYFSREARFEAVQALPTGGAHLTLTAEPGFTYAIEWSSDLANWGTLATILNVTGRLEVTDPAAGAGRFYRAVLRW